MNMHDNGKLVYILEQHCQEVLEVSPTTITVNGSYTIEGRPFCQKDILPANLVAIRDWLGY